MALLIHCWKVPSAFYCGSALASNSTTSIWIDGPSDMCDAKRDMFDRLYNVVYHPRVLRVYGTVTSFLHRHNFLRRSEFRASEIVPRLWLGDIYDAHNVAELRKRDIRHILTVIIGVRPSFPRNFEYLQIEACDTISQNISSHFEATNAFLDAVLNKPDGGGVLVHWYVTITIALFYSHVMQYAREIKKCIGCSSVSNAFTGLDSTESH